MPSVKRIFDITMALLGIFLLAIPMIIIAVIVKVSSHGPIVYWSTRVGRNNVKFRMPKFRTMYVDTPEVATHLLGDAAAHLTPIGAFLRKSSLDELPQLFNILVGDMSIIGPRPALYNQEDLIQLRTEKGVDTLTPGLTGWAQINGRDELSIPQKVQFDEYYLLHRSLILEAKIIIRTIKKVIRSEGILH
jgi:O-antigen biosynthesis protein WbqP